MKAVTLMRTAASVAVVPVIAATLALPRLNLRLPPATPVQTVELPTLPAPPEIRFPAKPLHLPGEYDGAHEDKSKRLPQQLPDFLPAALRRHVRFELADGARDRSALLREMPRILPAPEGADGDRMLRKLFDEGGEMPRVLVSGELDAEKLAKLKKLIERKRAEN